MNITYDQFEKMNEKFKELRVEAKTDVKIDRVNPFIDFNSEISMKWIQKRIEWQKLLRIYENERKQKFRSLYEYYKTDFNLKLNTKEEISVFIESDTNYVLILQVNNLCKDIISFVDSTIEVIKSRGWEIKEYLAFQRFSNGLS